MKRSGSPAYKKAPRGPYPIGQIGAACCSLLWE